MSLKSFHKWERVEPGDPNQCQAVRHGTHQCIYKALPGSKHCLKHHSSYYKSDKIKRMKNYLLTKFEARAQRFCDSEDIGSLNEEVAILRMLIEERLNKCEDTTDLLLVSGPLSDLLMKSEKLVTSMTKLEEKQGQQLNKDKIIQFAQIVIEIISKYVDNEEALDAIGEDILNTLKDISQNQD